MRVPPPPREQLAVSRSTIEAAQTAGAAELAPAELQSAVTKLNQAEAAVHDGKPLLAKRFAESAEADAQVARSKATAERSRRAADEVMAGLQTLRQQMASPSDSNLMPTPPAAGMPAPATPSTGR
ncbi:MAG: DUF4398 domain-containing protein [Aquabacterium sp.]